VRLFGNSLRGVEQERGVERHRRFVHPSATMRKTCLVERRAAYQAAAQAFQNLDCIHFVNTIRAMNVVVC
jgi:hypothetical protein